MPPPRRRSNFASVVRDSHKNAISLWEERAREAAQWRAFATPLALVKHKWPFYAPGRRSSASLDEEDEEGGVDGGQETQAHVELDMDSSPVHPAYLEPSSDDALNLFAYPDSSPVKGHRRVL